MINASLSSSVFGGFVQGETISCKEKNQVRTTIRGNMIHINWVLSKYLEKTNLTFRLAINSATFKRTFDHNPISQDQFDPFWCPRICSHLHHAVHKGHIKLLTIKVPVQGIVRQLDILNTIQIKVKFATFTKFISLIVVLFTY